MCVSSSLLDVVMISAPFVVALKVAFFAFDVRFPTCGLSMAIIEKRTVWCVLVCFVSLV